MLFYAGRGKAAGRLCRASGRGWMGPPWTDAARQAAMPEAHGRAATRASGPAPSRRAMATTQLWAATALRAGEGRSRPMRPRVKRLRAAALQAGRRRPACPRRTPDRDGRCAQPSGPVGAIYR